MTLLLVLGGANETLLGAAHVLRAGGHYGPAVVVAQTAVEVSMESAIEARLERAEISAALREWIAGTRGLTYSPRNDRVSELWTALTGNVIRREPWWGQYVAGVKARDAFVHRGARPTADVAAQFLEVAELATNHIAALAA